MVKTLIVIACLSVSLPASEALDRILATWDSEMLKARQVYDDTTAKSADKAGKSLETTAMAAGKKGDMAATTSTWKTLLSINPDHPKAREFFTATGNLDAVLKEVTQTTDLLGNPIAEPDLSVMPADAKTIDISAALGREAPLGTLKTGNKVLIQYAQGMWSPRPMMDDISPDDIEAPEDCRLALVNRSTGKVIAIIPAGTVAKPHVISIMNSVPDAVLCMLPPANQRSRGAVTYRVAVIP